MRITQLIIVSAIILAGTTLFAQGTTNLLPRDTTNPPATAPIGTEDLMPESTTPKYPKFFEWLLSLGVGTNTIEQLKQDLNIDQIREWLDELEEKYPKPTGPVKLFNNKNLKGFYTWTEKHGVYHDPDNVFTVTNGLLRISGQHRGYLCTTTIYKNFHLLAEYKWGDISWGKYKQRPRNSGIVIHAGGIDKVWMKGIEIQIADGQTGDIVVLDGARLTSSTGEFHSKPWSTFYRDDPKSRLPVPGYRAPDDPEKPHGEWNTVEIVALNGTLKVFINGKTVFSGREAHPDHGKIYIQSNGSEIFFRRLELLQIETHDIQ